MGKWGPWGPWRLCRRLWCGGGEKCGLCNTGPSFTFSLLQKVDEYKQCGRNFGGVADLNKNSDGLSKTVVLSLLHLLCSPSLEELYNASGSKESVGLSTGDFRYNRLFLRSLLASKL